MPIAVVFSQVFFGIITFTISVFLVLLVLVQRGRGGGLTGALGGPGGQSAFGTKAGDVFTKITVVTAGLWIFFCALGVWWMQASALPLGNSSSSGSSGAMGATSNSDTNTSPATDEPNTGGLLAPKPPEPPTATPTGTEGSAPTSNAEVKEIPDPATGTPAPTVPASSSPSPTAPAGTPEPSSPAPAEPTAPAPAAGTEPAVPTEPKG